jgi:nucleoside-diphosphate-sugar epimerase
MMNLIRQINSGFFLLFGSGKNPKATAYVGNLVDAIALQVSLLRPGIQVYNYADKPDLSVREIVTIIRQALGQSPRPLTLPLWLGILAAIPFELAAKLTGRNFPVSIARVKKLSQPTQVSAQRIRDAGFQQRVDSREGLQRMVRHFQEHRTEPKP